MGKTSAQPQDTTLQVTQDSYQAAVNAVQNSTAFTGDQKHDLCNALFYMCHQPQPAPTAEGDQAGEGDQGAQSENQSDQGQQF